jgi:predicted protein tyrosine phosphatase
VYALHLKRGNVAVNGSVYAYLDVAQVWLRWLLSLKQWGWVNSQVGYPILGYPFCIQQGRRQRLLLKQPSEACLRFFAERDGVQINHVELALDIITPFAWELKRAVIVGFVQRHHTTRTARRSKSNKKPRREVTIFPNDNFRTGDLGCRGSVFQAYDTKPSKVFGEFPCFHLEAKINGVRALRQLGISSLSDLLAFDHAQFWQRHFIVAEIDMARLGSLSRQPT